MNLKIRLVPGSAWADGEIQDNERTAILQGAHGKGLESGTDGILPGFARTMRRGSV